MTAPTFATTDHSLDHADIAVSVRGLSKHYGDTVALDAVDFDLPVDTICGLFGRNGAGKTTLMSILTAQNFATSGQVLVCGEPPYENPRVLERICFVREGQKYPDDTKPKHAFATAKLFFPNWDDDFAQQLVADFALPMDCRIKKLSRGQLSAVGVIIGLASRADITFFDEPYLGLDAVARQTFYDRLLADYAAHPRTIVISSHLIDEIGSLIERVLVVDAGRIVLNEDADDLRDRAVTVVGSKEVVDDFVSEREELHRDRLGATVAVTVLGGLNDDERRELDRLGLITAPVSLQELIVRLTQHTGGHESPTAVSTTPASTSTGALR